MINTVKKTIQTIRHQYDKNKNTYGFIVAFMLFAAISLLFFIPVLIGGIFMYIFW